MKNDDIKITIIATGLDEKLIDGWVKLIDKKASKDCSVERSISLIKDLLFAYRQKIYSEPEITTWLNKALARLQGMLNE